MINKVVDSLPDALAGLKDGSVLLVGGHGPAGMPQSLLRGVLDAGVRDLTIIANHAGFGPDGIEALIRESRVRKVICSYPRAGGGKAFKERYLRHEIELELVPQGTLTERIRAGGMGIPAFYTATAAHTLLGDGKEVRTFNGRDCVLEQALRGDFALVKAHRGDRWGNLTYRKAARNFNPSMATAAEVTIAEVDEVVSLGDIDPDLVITPGIFVDRVIAAGKRDGV